MICAVDTGPLYAAPDSNDRRHTACVAALTERGRDLVIPALVVAEVTYLIGERMGADAEAIFLESLQDYEVEAPLPQEWGRIAELARQHRAFPLGGTDASVIALAERLDTPLIATLDRRHFLAVRPKHCAAFEIIPNVL